MAQILKTVNVSDVINTTAGEEVNSQHFETDIKKPTLRFELNLDRLQRPGSCEVLMLLAVPHP